MSRAYKRRPTDVIAGSAGGVGVIVPHLHRAEHVAQRRVWVGFAPVRAEGERGGALRVRGTF